MASETGSVLVLTAALFFIEVSIMFTTPVSWGDIHFFFIFIFYLDTFSELVKGKTTIDSRMIFFYFLKLLVTYKIMVQNLDYLLTLKNFENWLLSIAFVIKSSPSISSLSKTFEHHGFKNQNDQRIKIWFSSWFLLIKPSVFTDFDRIRVRFLVEPANLTRFLKPYRTYPIILLSILKNYGPTNF